MSKAIRIEDLADPVFSEADKKILAYGEKLEVDLSRDSILQEARNITGLDDFGPPDFLERIDLLLDEWNSDPGINNLGRDSLRGKLLQDVRNRLMIEEQFRLHPEINDVPIEKPIIVLGLPRSGTTHLLNLLGADSRLRALALWESWEPVPNPREALLEDGTDPRYQRCADAWESMQRAKPLQAAMHPMNPDHIHEEIELMGADIASYYYEWLSPSPRWRDYYYQSDQTPHYEYMKKVLKLLLWQERGEGRPTRWVLKCPQHLEQIPVLLKTFPDATFVVTHRDPVSVIQSTVTMQAYGERLLRHEIDTKVLIDYWSDRIEHLLRACARDRSSLPEGQSIDVPFHEFMADDMAMIEKIFLKAGLELTPEARGELEAFIDGHPRGKEGRLVYDLEGDFGVTREELHKRFEFYFEQFPARRESH